MRAGGYELDRKQWVPASVKKAREETRAKIAAAVSRRKEILRAFQEIPRANVNWYSLVRAEEDRHDARFIAMSEQDWRQWQVSASRTWRTPTQRFSGQAFCRRIEDLRHPRPAPVEISTGEVSPVVALLRERRELLEFPQGNGLSTQEEQDAAVAEIEAKIQELGSGRWRLAAAKISEEKDDLLREAARNLDRVCTIQRVWRKVIQRRVIHALAAKFGIY